MDFVLRAVQSPAVKVIAGVVVLGLLIAGTFFVVMPRNSRFVVQTKGPASSAESSGETGYPPPSQAPPATPLPTSPPEVTPTALPERTQVTVVLQQAGATAEEFAKVRDLARSLGYTVRTIPPASTPLDRSKIAYPPGSRAVAERLAQDLRPRAQLVENPSSVEILLSLGRS